MTPQSLHHCLLSFYNYARGHYEASQSFSGDAQQQHQWCLKTRSRTAGTLSTWQMDVLWAYTLSLSDWCCVYYFVRNSVLALLEALCARILFFRFVNIGLLLNFFSFFLRVQGLSLSLTKAFFPPLSTRLLCLVVTIPLVYWLYMCACVCVPLYVHVKMCR